MGIELEDAARLRLALGRISRQVERQVAGGILTRTQLSVLTTVARRGPMRVSEVAEREGINPTMLSRIIGKLEGAQLLQRTTHPADGRAVQVAVTEAGAGLDERLRAERTALFAEKLAALSEPEYHQLIDALTALESLADLLAGAPRTAPALDPALDEVPDPALTR